MIARRDVFQAIADPTRRAIINLVATQPRNVNAIADEFAITRQAVSLHLKILIECELVSVKKEGRDRLCEARLDQLSEVSAWINQYKQHWESKFDAMETYIEKLKKERHGK
ncbi:metalloregulator ArsR/SmtB family transcription factor [Mucilaginibacter sp. HMF5004]|uniref:ArsR/SmtB family transcription factor n=1 Tax=Mucilaginibacter rivuli TaxID=2857527 RepID=UPI001C5EA33E|nr:metalloregulator ArsR/SmtB family transcription factor [Mucilaginibacter rivuli]MBW4889811.1 metalloregulator ArsR/SmtB family transcription factor [Mucilaginibacter rivuli]